MWNPSPNRDMPDCALVRFGRHRAAIAGETQMWLNADKATALLSPMPPVAQALDTIFARSSVLEPFS
jgi:hypothetical protein